MKDSYFRVEISETARGSLRKSRYESGLFNIVIEVFKSLNEVEQYLIDRYGKLPKSRKCVDNNNKHKRGE